MFCLNTQKLLKLIYDLTRNGRPFIWTKVHQDASEEIQTRLSKPTVFTSLRQERKIPIIFRYYKTAAGPALHQFQNSSPKLNCIASKRLRHEAVYNSPEELELLSLWVNISQFKHLLAKVDFDCTVDHLALAYIMKSKTEPVSMRITRLIEDLSTYSFNP